jgi:hypothetical protein
VAERLAAHRDRRRRPRAEAAAVLAPAPTPTAAPAEGRATSARATRIAAAVAERYARSPSYRAYLAAEAEKALDRARAAAEIAELNVRAVAEAQRQLMDALVDSVGCELNGESLSEDAAGGASASVAREAAGSEEILSVYDEAVQEQLREMTLWPEIDGESSPRPSVARRQTATQKAAPNRSHPNASTAASPSQTGSAALLFAQAAPDATAGLTVRLYQDAYAALPAAELPAGRSLGGARAMSGAKRSMRYEERNDAEALALDEEIAFRQSPVFDEPATPPQPLPANLIEFPRQLIASRKARPRYAEGPLLDEAGAVAGAGQLRIFEVDPAEISTTPTPAGNAMPQWTSIWLDGPGRAPSGHTAADGEAAAGSGQQAEREGAAAVLLPASMGRRVAAAAVNGAVIFTGFGVFAAVFAMVAGRLSGSQSAVLASGLAERGGLIHGGLGQLALLAGRTGVQPGTAAVASAVVLGALYVVYQALFFWFSEATPGMRIARIALCTFTEESPSRGAVRRRVPAVLLSACALGLGFAWAVLDEDRLTWHDRATRMYQRGY